MRLASLGHICRGACNSLYRERAGRRLSGSDTSCAATMYGLAHLLLLLIHTLYGFKNFLFSLVPPRHPKPLLARRRRLPLHLALLLIPDAENHDTREEEGVMEECVEHVLDWCKKLEIQRLSVYDRDGARHKLLFNVFAHPMPGVLSRKSVYASPAFSNGLLEISDDASFSRRPLTPPLSDTDSSRAKTPDLEKKTGTTVCTFQIPYRSRNATTENEKMKTSHRRRHSRTS